MKFWTILLTLSLISPLGLAQVKNSRQQSGKVYRHSVKKPNQIAKRQSRNSPRNIKTTPKKQQKDKSKTKNLKTKKPQSRPAEPKKKLSDWDRARILWFKDVIERADIRGR